jgi:hypothetical protein
MVMLTAMLLMMQEVIIPLEYQEHLSQIEVVMQTGFLKGTVRLQRQLHLQVMQVIIAMNI